MPAGNGMGPRGMGPMTGRTAGFCAGFGVPGYVNPGTSRGCGFGGRGGGRGWRNMFHATGLPGWARGGVPAALAPAQELDVLKQQAESLGHALEDIRKRVQELESQPVEK